jgi:hypothetical protein
MNDTKVTPQQLVAYANEYINECLTAKEERLTNTGQVVLLKNRKLPTIQYFLAWWIPHGTPDKKPTICRKTFYNWKESTDPDKKETALYIDELFEAIATDILANDNKGASSIFYAKNKMNWTDKVQNESTLNVKETVLQFFENGTN